MTQIIEQNMTWLDGLLYMASTSDNDGNVAITLTFASGTNPDIAQVQVQNRLQQAVPLLPQIVQQQGISVTKANNNFLMGIGFLSDRRQHERRATSPTYLATNVVDPVSRVPGVGGSLVFGAKYAMRIWLDPDKLNTYGLTPADVVNAIRPRMRSSRSVSSALPPPLTGSAAQRHGHGARAACRRRSNSAISCCAVIPTARRCGCATWRASSSARPTTASDARYNGQPASGMRRHARDRRQCARHRARRARRCIAQLQPQLSAWAEGHHFPTTPRRSCASRSRRWSRPCSRRSCWCSW